MADITDRWSPGAVDSSEASPEPPLLSSNYESQIPSPRRMPHSMEAEQATLGGVLLDPAAWDRISDKIVSDDFYFKAHRFIYSRMQLLSARHQPIDLATLSQTFEGSSEIESVGGNPYLVELMRNTPSAANIVAYAGIVREFSILRQLIRVSQEMAESAYETKGREAHELLDEAERKVFEIANQTTRGQAPVGISELLARAIARVHELEKLGSTITGIETGFVDFDQHTSGLQKGDLIIVAGRPSMGKTTFAMNLAEGAIVSSAEAMMRDPNNQVKALPPVLVFSMEMPGEMLALRLLSSLSHIELSKLRTGMLSSEDWDRLGSSIEILRQSKMLIDDTGSLTPGEVRTRARRVVREHGAVGLIVIDYLQLMRVPGHKENRNLEISEISRSLKALAKELAVPVVALSQLNRELEHRPNKRPVMSDLRESGAIEQDADLIIFIYRDEVYNTDSPEKGVAEIIIGKHRNGPTGTVRLTFKREISRFEDFASERRFNPPPFSAPPT